MSQVDLERVQNDLDSMRRVIQRDRPYAAADMLPNVVIGVGALLCLGLLQSELFGDQRLCMLLSISPGLALYARRYMQTHRGRARRPVLWKEYKWSMVALFVLPTSAVAWMWYGERFGYSRESSVATILFSMGLVTTMIGVMDSSRRFYLPSGLLLLGYSVLRPILPPEQLVNSGCVLLALASLGSAIYIGIAIRLGGNGLTQDESVA